MNTVCILGMGYIGLPTAAMFATHGVKVTGVDINKQIINTLQEGKIHIYEPGLSDLVQQAWRSQNLKVASTPEEADAFIIAVPTPFNPDKTADMRAVISATESLVPYLRPGNLVVLESTSPPRTTVDLVKPILERSGLKAGIDFYLAYTPERILPGKMIKELIENARVIGGITPACAQAGRNLYGIFVKGEIILTDSTTAEMVKLMENTSRDVNIAIANEFARLAERVGVNVWDAIRIANHHPRINILNPGPGVGGHCISVDPWFLVEAAPDITPLIHTARNVNDDQPHHVIQLLQRCLSELAGKRIAVLGLSYKADVDDLRESPAVEIAQLLAKAGAKILAYEPYKPDAKFLDFDTVGSLEDVFSAADAAIVLVAHKTFRALLPEQVKKLMPGRIIVDTVNVLDNNLWSQAGFTVSKLGVGYLSHKQLPAS